MVKCKNKTLPSTHSHTEKENNKTSDRSNGVAKRPFKGVRMRSWGSWVSEIRAPGHKTRIWLGSYSTAEAAARAYDAALVCLKGSDALSGLNFPSASTTADMSSNVGNCLLGRSSSTCIYNITRKAQIFHFQILFELFPSKIYKILDYYISI